MAFANEFRIVFIVYFGKEYILRGKAFVATSIFWRIPYSRSVFRRGWCRLERREGNGRERGGRAFESESPQYNSKVFILIGIAYSQREREDLLEGEICIFTFSMKRTISNTDLIRRG